MIEVEMERFVMACDDLRREVFGLDQGSAGGDGCLFESVLEFANVARPVVAHEPRERLPRERFGREAPVGHLVEEMVDQEWNVFQALAQRGNFDRDDVEAVEEVLAEAACYHGVGENDVGRGDDAAIGLDRVGSTHAFESSVLEDAKQLGLHSERHFADFVEEQGSPLGEFEPAFFLAVGPGERTAFVAEELAFQQVLGECGAVDREQRSRAA